MRFREDNFLSEYARNVFEQTYKMYQTETTAGKKVEITFEGDQPKLNGTPVNWSISSENNRTYLIINDHKPIKAKVLKFDSLSKSVEIKINKNIYNVSLKDKMDLLLEKMGIDMAITQAVNDLKAPMPGLVLDILVNEGQEIKKGDRLAILEAMKMENVLKAVGDGTVKSIEVGKGDSVEKNQILIKF